MGRGSVIWSLYFSDWAWPAMPPPKNTSIIVKPSHRRWINQRATQLQICFCNHYTAGLQKHYTSFSCGNNKQLLHFHFVQPSLESHSYLQSFCKCIVKCWSLHWLQKLKNQIWVQYYNITTFFTASDYGFLLSSRNFDQKSTQTSWLQFAQIAYLANMAL